MGKIIGLTFQEEAVKAPSPSNNKEKRETPKSAPKRPKKGRTEG